MSGRWEVRRDGVALCSGSMATMPDSLQRKSMREGGCKIYVDGKIFKEEKQDGKEHTVRQNPAAHARLRRN